MASAFSKCFTSIGSYWSPFIGSRIFRSCLLELSMRRHIAASPSRTDVVKRADRCLSSTISSKCSSYGWGGSTAVAGGCWAGTSASADVLFFQNLREHNRYGQISQQRHVDVAVTDNWYCFVLESGVFLLCIFLNWHALGHFKWVRALLIPIAGAHETVLNLFQQDINGPLLHATCSVCRYGLMKLLFMSVLCTHIPQII